MDHLTIEQKRLPEGGDKHSPAAKVEIGRREQQVVELKLRGYSYAEIGRVVGVSKQACEKLFKRALHRNTDADIQTHHRIELAKLELEELEIWKILDRPENKEQDKIRLACFGRLKDIHIRRAKLLGLDAPTKLDVTDIYKRGGNDASAEQLAREAVIEALPIEEQRRIYELFYQAGKRAAAGDFSQPAMETTVSSGPDNRNGVEPSDDADPSDA